MIVTVEVPMKLHRRLLADKRRTGASKSTLVRQMIERHYAEHDKLNVTNANKDAA